MRVSLAWSSWLAVSQGKSDSNQENYEIHYISTIREEEARKWQVLVLRRKKEES